MSRVPLRTLAWTSRVLPSQSLWRLRAAARPFGLIRSADLFESANGQDTRAQITPHITGYALPRAPKAAAGRQ